MKTILIKERPDLKTSEIMELMKKKFNVWSYYNNEQLDKDFPAPKEATERYFLDSVEPDSETLGLSTKEAEAKGFTNGITLRERMLLELEYFERTGNHLDIKGVTLCGGSRYSDGGVPRVDWYLDDQEVSVSWYGVDYSFATGGLRSCVNIEKEVVLKDETNKDKQGFCIACERCGFSRNN